MHKAIRRLQPAPRARPTRHRSLASEFGATASTAATKVADEEEVDDGGAEPSLQQQAIPVLRALSRSNTAVRALSTSPKTTTVMMRRCSAGADGRLTKSTVPVRANIDEMWQHLRHLGPSNRANNPKNTRSTTVKIKPSHSHAGHQALLEPVIISDYLGTPRIDDETDDELEAGETTLLLAPKASNGNGTESSSRGTVPDYGTARHVSQDPDADIDGDEVLIDVIETPIIEIATGSSDSVASRDSGKQKFPASLGQGGSSISIDVNASRTSIPGDSAVRSSSESSPNQTSAMTTMVDFSTPVSRRTIVRSGSITENVIETRGIRKVVLETTSSAEDDEDAVGVLTSSFVQQRSPLSGVHSPVVPRKPASGAEEETVRDKDLEAKLLAAQSAAASASTIPPSSSSQLDGAEVDSSETTTAGNGSGPSKKKNRRKKRKNAK